MTTTQPPVPSVLWAARVLATLSLIASIPGLAFAADAARHEVRSPDGRIALTLETGTETRYSFSVDGTPVVTPSVVSLSLGDGRVLGRGPVTRVDERQASEEFATPHGKRARVKNAYREKAIVFAEGGTLRARVFDDGFALRWETALPGRVKVRDEGFEVAFPAEPQVTFHPVATFVNNHESIWKQGPLSAIDDGAQGMATLPIVFHLPSGGKLGLLLSDLDDYPAMYLAYRQSSTRGLVGRFPRRAAQEGIGGYRGFNAVVTGTTDDIAETAGTRTFPWKAFVVARRDPDLMANDMVMRLTPPPAAGSDFSWVKPGRVVWDFWADWNLEGVGFAAGRNNETFRYHIDFAGRNGFEYVNIDWLWSDPLDLFALNPDVDVPALVEYARSKGVGIVVWCLTRTLEAQLVPAMDRFQKWGVAGLKIDFFDRDDQRMVSLYRRFAEEAAKRRMIVLYHGATAPTGLQRTYPNVLGYEAVRGMEYDKFSKEGSPPPHTVALPFTRQLAGPLDYTPGAMRNANRATWSATNDLPRSQGTRARQLAMYVVYDAPLVMLSDMPTAYEKEPVILDYLKAVPTVWDETLGVDGRIGEYAVLARRKGNEWWVGAMTDWSERTVEVPLAFLGACRYEATVYADGANANRVATDYTVTKETVDASGRVKVVLRQGGGAVIRLRPLP
jgi:alpha-glucosidase